MHRSFWSFFILALFVVCMVVLPAGGSITLTGNDTKFLSDVTKEGVPLLYTIPEAMKNGFFNGDGSAIPAVGKNQSEILDAFVTRINGYTISENVKPVRDQFLNTTDIYKKDLTEYQSLVNTCGSCISKMNQMYPNLIEEANKTSDVISQFSKNTTA